MYKLPSELIYYISRFPSINDLISFSKTCKVNNEICKKQWRDIFRFVYPIIPTTRGENYSELFGKYYDIFSYSETLEPIIKCFVKGNEDVVRLLHDIGADNIKSHPHGGFKPNVKPDVILLPFVDSPYYFKGILFVSNFIMFIANELPDIKSGKIFPTGLYIKYCLKNGDIAKLYNKFDKGILLKWLILDIYYIGISPNDIIAPSSKLAKLLIKSVDEIIDYLGDILYGLNLSEFLNIFKDNYITLLIKLYANQLNIRGINNIKDKINYSQIDDEFTRDVLEILDNIDEYTVNYYDTEIDLICRSIARTEDYEYIRPFVYNLINKYPDQIYRAAVFSLLRKEDKYSLLPIKLDKAKSIYYYLTGDIDLLDMADEPELLKLILTIQYRIDKLTDTDKVDYLYKLFNNKIPSNLINYIYRNNITKSINTISDIVKIYGNPIDFSQIDDDILDRMDFITSLAMMNNFHNILNYVNICVDRDIDNEIVRNIISRPECYGMLLDSWPKSKKYMDMVEFSSDIKRYKAARRSANIYFNINLPDKIDGLVYLLNKLLPNKDEVDRFLVHIFKDKFTEYFPNYKLNINYLMFDSIAIKHLYHSDYSFGDIYKIIEDNIDIYPFSCIDLIRKLLRDKRTKDEIKELDNYFRSLGENGTFLFHNYLLNITLATTRDEVNSILGYNVTLKQKPIIYSLNFLTNNLLRSEFGKHMEIEKKFRYAFK